VYAATASLTEGLHQNRLRYGGRAQLNFTASAPTDFCYTQTLGVIAKAKNRLTILDIFW